MTSTDDPDRHRLRPPAPHVRAGGRRGLPRGRGVRRRHHRVGADGGRGPVQLPLRRGLVRGLAGRVRRPARGDAAPVRRAAHPGAQAPVPRLADRYVGGARRSGRPDRAGARRDHGRGLPGGHRPRGRGRRAVRRPDGAAGPRHGRRGRGGAARRAVRGCGSLAAARARRATCSWCCSPPCSDRWSPGGSRSACGCWASRPWAWPSVVRLNDLPRPSLARRPPSVSPSITTTA